MPKRILAFVPADLAAHEAQYPVEVLDDGVRLEVRVGERLYTAARDRQGSMRITSDPATAGTVAWTVAAGDVRWVFLDGKVFELTEARPAARARGGHHGSLTAPMPATVRRVLVGVGDAVKRGEPLVILEAMKMEIPVHSPFDGTVTAVHVTAGDRVAGGALVVELES
jgi:acetyl-CoA/propionyl-CoA carboxylase biotin carboxyl carrier protein